MSNLWDCEKVIQEFENNLKSRAHEHAKKLIKKSKMGKVRVVLQTKGKKPGRSKASKVSTAHKQILLVATHSSKNKNRTTNAKSPMKEGHSQGKKKESEKCSPTLKTILKLETKDKPKKKRKHNEIKSAKSRGVKNKIIVSKKIKKTKYSPGKSKKIVAAVEQIDGGEHVHVNGEVSFLIRRDASENITPSIKKKVLKVEKVSGMKNKESVIKSSESTSKSDSLGKKSLPENILISKKNKDEKKEVTSSAKNTPKKVKLTPKAINVKKSRSPILGEKILKISVEKFNGLPGIAQKSLSPDEKPTFRKKVGNVSTTPKAKCRKSQDNHEIKSKKRKMEKQEEVFIVTDSDTDDDVLYSLVEANTTKEDVSKNIPKSKSDLDSTTAKDGSVNLNNFSVKKVKKSASTSGQDQAVPSGISKAKRMRLIDSMKNKKHNSVMRPISPTPLFTTVKPITANYVKPTSSESPASLDKYNCGEMSHYQYIPATVIPISPSSMTYQVLLDNLQTQLQPKKGVKRKEPDSVAMTAAGDVERRLSVRQSECAFRYKEIVVKKCQKYTQIWLNTHTTMKNALNPQVIQEAMAALNSAKYDDSSLVMFSGLGNVFCSGIDLHFLISGDRRMAARQMVDALREFTKALIMFSKPIVAVVTGPAIGLGMTMLPLCDVVYASDKATFYLPYAQLGQTPEGCATYTLPQAMGMAMANELLMGSRKITAIEACQLGLVSQVFWPTSMMQEVIPRIQNMAVLSSKALETTKLLIRSHQRTKLDLTNESEIHKQTGTQESCHLLLFF
ncbi:hypothetical protein CHS0354_008661 [Potamilus streckersoni]|uniref:Chromodomain Y-like protein 2 n=1 Tax=Potamilus streckersoni TaxID=2493646 RepID=A0AAE0WD73_9BIVA|nr:hypothetical protein CHS0354_008661 [Potamilus streckersoni]